MKKHIDILLDENGDLLLDENGEPVVGDVTQQNQKLIINTNKGDWRLYPLVGVGKDDYVDDENPAGLLREIRQQLIRDGFKVESIKLVENKIKVNASYP